jgi:hypothetical protein
MGVGGLPYPPEKFWQATLSNIQWYVWIGPPKLQTATAITMSPYICFAKDGKLWCTSNGPDSENHIVDTTLITCYAPAPLLKGIISFFCINWKAKIHNLSKTIWFVHVWSNYRRNEKSLPLPHPKITNWCY